MLPPLKLGAPKAVAENVAVASVVLPDSAVSGVAGIVPESSTSVPLLESAQAAASATDAVFCAVFMEFPSGKKKPPSGGHGWNGCRLSNGAVSAGRNGAGRIGYD